MKTILISILLMIMVNHAQAAKSNETTHAENAKKSSAKKSKLSTDIKFDAHTVGGQVQTPFESLTEVENEKEIDQLIGVRKNFNDRISKSSQMR